MALIFCKEGLYSYIYSKELLGRERVEGEGLTEREEGEKEVKREKDGGGVRAEEEEEEEEE